MILNSGNANACTGAKGLADARSMAAAAAKRTGLAPEQILLCSTGRIGVAMPIDRIGAGLASIWLSRRGSSNCAKAIMTSDTFPKEVAFGVESEAGTFRIGAIAKGAGMINPNMATMLCVITTYAAVPQPALRVALRAAVEKSFNRITIDGDMSTNDTVILLANGESGVNPPLAQFQEALDRASKALARMIVEDGEGASRFVEVEVRGAASAGDARRAAEAVANSTLVKCAWAGGDPNWGRIMDALGYSGARMLEEKTDICTGMCPSSSAARCRAHPGRNSKPSLRAGSFALGSIFPSVSFPTRYGQPTSPRNTFGSTLANDMRIPLTPEAQLRASSRRSPTFKDFAGKPSSSNMVARRWRRIRSLTGF